MKLFQQSESVSARRDLFVEMVDPSGNALTGLTLTVSLVKAGSTSYAAIAGTSEEVGDGTYVLHLAAADLDTLGQAMLKVTASGALAQKIPLQVVRFLDEIHSAKAALVNAYDHDIESGVDRVLDDDGETVLHTLTPAETIEFTGAGWTNASKYITKAGAFAGYLWKSGDQVTLTAGTGVTTGQYEIAAKVDDDTIELAGDINDDGGDISDASIEGKISTARIMRTVS